MTYSQDFSNALQQEFSNLFATRTQYRLTPVGTTGRKFNLEIVGGSVPVTDGGHGSNIHAQRASTGSTEVLTVTVNPSIAAGDKADIVFDGTTYSITANASAPFVTLTVVGAALTTTAAGGTAASKGVSDRQLVVYEANTSSPDFGRMIAIPPNQASSIAIPTFRVQSSLPTVGTVAGETVYALATNQGYVWTGSKWADIAATPITSYPTDADLKADTLPTDGTYAIARDTGNFYVKITGGWRFVGTKIYATSATLLADTGEQPGTEAVAIDDDSTWIYTTAGWRCTNTRSFATTADLDAWTTGATIGDRAVVTDIGVEFVRTTTGFRPSTIYEETEANIRAATTWPKAGQTAIATDTGRTFVHVGTAWVEEPINHFATETALLASTPVNGTIAWSDDTNVVFTRANNTWHRISGPQISVGTTVPTTPAAGDMFYSTATGTVGLQLYDGAKWVNTSGVTLGAAGTKAPVPGYDGENPSDTAVSDAVGGIAYRYEGTTGKRQLFMKSGTAWDSITPMLGDTTNAGKLLVADATGNPSWDGDVVHKAIRNADHSRVFYSTDAVSIQATEYIEINGYFMCLTASKAAAVALDVTKGTGGTLALNSYCQQLIIRGRASTEYVWKHNHVADMMTGNVLRLHPVDTDAAMVGGSKSTATFHVRIQPAFYIARGADAPKNGVSVHSRVFYENRHGDPVWAEMLATFENTIDQWGTIASYCEGQEIKGRVDYRWK